MLKEATIKSERELILSDPIICAVLKVEAENVGVTVEEYCACFLQNFYTNSDAFICILNESKV